MNADDLEIPKEVAERIRRPVGWLAKLRMTGEGPAYLKIGGKVLYRRRDVDAWLADCERASTAQPLNATRSACREVRPDERVNGSPIQGSTNHPKQRDRLAAARKDKEAACQLADILGLQ